MGGTAFDSQNGREKRAFEPDPDARMPWRRMERERRGVRARWVEEARKKDDGAARENTHSLTAEREMFDRVSGDAEDNRHPPQHGPHLLESFCTFASF